MAGKKFTVVAIGSRNRAKTEGVKKAFQYVFPDAQFKTIDVTSRVRAQPLSLDETVEGARLRAELAIKNEGASFGVGVEAGLVELVKGFFLNVQIAAIADSAGNLSYGCSSGFPIPSDFVAKLKQGRGELDRYTHELTGAKKVREEEGIVYRLTGRRLSRVEMTEQCVSMALVPWMNGRLYGFT